MTYHIRSTRVLIDTYREMKANPDRVYCITVPDWFNEYWNYAQLRAWFMQCLHNKINRNDTRTGRCFTPDYQRDAWMDARTVNQYYGQRVRHSGSSGLLRTPEARNRYPEVNTQPMEY